MSWSSFLVVFVTTSLVSILTYLPVTSSASISEVQEVNARSPRIARSASSSSYEWLCPTATCAPVSPDCTEVEYMVFEYDVLLGSRSVNVRCQTCEYCLDMPFRLRRSSSTTRRRHTHSCSRLRCPIVVDACSDVRLTDVFVNDRYCKKCAACYDNMLITDH
ncbi:hypothetical protein CAPTEDRAFT_220549 [Capitella teleta]|uniref:Uncharacterized protein n=1 Tax=Capitella teleta TaxID=283909 RepID=R7TBH3_CAPTE|nr:hypothetical protein CAPTEDRAFT_220549 [Capitella teleta]|eukprot:ELT88832.1 hypothetical protein CAPTEDRAFT_220549 [Capitella teleta]